MEERLPVLAVAGLRPSNSHGGPAASPLCTLAGTGFLWVDVRPSVGVLQAETLVSNVLGTLFHPLRHPSISWSTG